MGMSVLLWTYAGLLVAGGIMGFVKARSKVSLVASVACAVPIAMVGWKHLPMIVAQVVMGLLIVLFSVRWAKTNRPMPGAPMILLTLAVLTTTLLLPA